MNTQPSSFLEWNISIMMLAYAECIALGPMVQRVVREWVGGE